MSAATPGQAAFEAWEALIAPPGKPMTWESLQGAESRDYRTAWEAAAQAAIGEHIRELSAARVDPGDVSPRYAAEAAAQEPPAPELAGLRGALAAVIALTDASVGHPDIADFDNAGRLLTRINQTARAALGQPADDPVDSWARLRETAADNIRLRGLLAEILGTFAPVATGSGYVSRSPARQVAEWRNRAEMPA